MNCSIFFICIIFFITGCGIENKNKPLSDDYEVLEAEGEKVCKNVYIDMFRYLEVDLNANIDLIQSDSLLVSIDGNKNIVNLVDVKVSNSKMKLQLKKSIIQNSELNLKVYVPNLQYILMNGSGKINMQNWSNEDRLSLKNNGSATFTLNEFRKIKHLNIELHGEGNFVSKGESDKINSIKCILNGSGNINFETLSSINTDVVINGAGNVELGEIEFLNALINGSGNIFYKGFPKIQQKNIGSGTLIQK